MLQDPSIQQLERELLAIKKALPELAKRGEDFAYFIDARGVISL